ncbi:LamG-like jellyroll fold domain-containing protein [Spartinivicinus poritis]|uniref:LamG-like jellyroll fold domain-containing protein n=1 Tax=Spartinivicinus poritis TaxID=2994640 RepID=A0ABT5UBM0_9GAMM|nr:LamG-like jellyroll fold domain-containing protein [Spartinivicinus sp. A2-2]MDE1462509.1 hypothetical protein [Spartinivicinus sp. A2-2]
MLIIQKFFLKLTGILLLFVVSITSYGMLPNASFEQGDVGGRPDEWKWFGSDESFFPQIVNDAYHGEQAVRIPVRDKEWGDAVSGIKPSDHLTAGSQKFYKFGFYYKSRDLKSVRIRMRMYDASDTSIGYVDSLFGVEDMDTWAYGELHIKATKPETTYISPQFSGVGIRGWERLHLFHDYDYLKNVSKNNDVHDISEFTNHGSFIGDAALDEGKYGVGLNLDGKGDAVVIPHDDSLNLKDEFTIEAWIAPRNSAEQVRRTIVGKKGSFELYLEGSKLVFRGYGLNIQTHEAKFLSHANNWTHVAVSYRGYDLKIYINGKEQYKNGGVFGDLQISHNDLYTGSYDKTLTNTFNGRIDELRIYKEGLTTLQVVQDMNKHDPSPVLWLDNLSMQEIGSRNGIGEVRNRLYPQIFPVPKHVSWNHPGKFGKFTINNETVIYVPDLKSIESAMTLRAEIKHYFGLSLPIRPWTANDRPYNAILMGTIAAKNISTILANEGLLRYFQSMSNTGQGYVIKLDSKGIILAGQDYVGSFFSSASLLQVLKFNYAKKTEPVSPFGLVVDYPDTSNRGFHYTMYKDKLKMDMKTWEELVRRTLSQFKVNELQLYLGNLAIGDGRYYYNWDRFLTPQEMQKLIHFAKQHYFEKVVPTVYGGALFRKKHPEWAWVEKSGKIYSHFFDTTNPGYQTLTDAYYKDILSAFPSEKVFNIAHDESFGHYWVNGAPFEEQDFITQGPGRFMEPRVVWSDSIIRQCKYLSELGIQEIRFWADGLAPDRNGGPPFHTDAQLSAIAKNCENIVPMYWMSRSKHYERGFIKKLQKGGFDTVIYSSNKADTSPYELPKMTETKTMYSNKWSSPYPWCSVMNSTTQGKVSEGYADYWSFSKIVHEANLFWNTNQKNLPHFWEFTSKYGIDISRITSVSPNLYGGDTYKVFPVENYNADLIGETNDWSLASPGFDFSQVVMKGNEPAESFASVVQTLPEDSPNSLVLSAKGAKSTTQAVNETVSSISIVISSAWEGPDQELSMTNYMQRIQQMYRNYYTTDDGRDGGKIAYLTLNYTDGTTYEEPIRFGNDVYLHQTNDMTRIAYGARDILHVPAGPMRSNAAYIWEVVNPAPCKKVESVTLWLNDGRYEPEIDTGDYYRPGNITTELKLALFSIAGRSVKNACMAGNKYSSYNLN